MIIGSRAFRLMIIGSREFSLMIIESCAFTVMIFFFLAFADSNDNSFTVTKIESRAFPEMSIGPRAYQFDSKAMILLCSNESLFYVHCFAFLLCQPNSEEEAHKLKEYLYSLLKLCCE
jgi:hypothetical protein